MANERFRIVLVGTEYELNLGSVARAMKNFGFSELFLVSPKCEPLGFDSVKYSKHARDVLEGAKVVKTLSQATSGCKFAIGTTGVLYRHWAETIRSPILLSDLKKKLATLKEGKAAIVFGSEGLGLSEEHISQCDFLITIPASNRYPILNLSHAVAICLYELSAIRPRTFTPSGESEKEHLIAGFSMMVDRYKHVMRNPRKVKIAFRRMVGKSMLTDKECASILGVVRRAGSELAAIPSKPPRNRVRKP
ncbi:MAG: RNA methyltransferase [Candidatus Micrarchaeia archaeon]